MRQAGSLDFRVANGNLQSFVGGSVQARGGYVLKTASGDIDLTDFRLKTRADNPLVLDLVGADGKAWFYVDRLMYELVDDNKILAVRAMDLRVSPALANRLGHPDMADWAIADMEMNTQVLTQGSGAVPNGGGCLRLGRHAGRAAGRRATATAGRHQRSRSVHEDLQRPIQSLQWMHRVIEHRPGGIHAEFDAEKQRQQW